jgi:hypothetical protein
MSRTTTVNLLTNVALEPFGKIPEFKFCAVRRKPVGIRTAAVGQATAGIIAPDRCQLAKGACAAILFCANRSSRHCTMDCCGPSGHRPALSVHDTDMDHYRRLVRATASARGACRKVHEVRLGAAGAADIRDAQALRTARNTGFPPTIRAAPGGAIRADEGVVFLSRRARAR